MPVPRNEVLRDAAPEQRNGVKSFLGRHKGKLMLALGLAAAGAGTYGLGKLGLSGKLTAANSPEWFRGLSAQASRVPMALQRISKGRFLPNEADRGLGQAVRTEIQTGTYVPPSPPITNP